MLSLLTLIPYLMGAVLSAPAPAPAPALRTLSEAEVVTLINGTIEVRGIPPSCVCGPALVGDGSPVQMYKQQQVTNKVSDCGASTQCSTTKSEGKSWSWGVGEDLESGEEGFISGGFDVSESFESGQSEGCANSGPVTNICLFYSQAYTAYQVANTCEGNCGGGQGTPYTMFAPNNGNAGGLGYYCVVNTCGDNGGYYWKTGAAGGPP